MNCDALFRFRDIQVEEDKTERKKGTSRKVGGYKLARL